MTKPVGRVGRGARRSNEAKLRQGVDEDIKHPILHSPLLLLPRAFHTHFLSLCLIFFFGAKDLFWEYGERDCWMASFVPDVRFMAGLRVGAIDAWTYQTSTHQCLGDTEPTTVLGRGGWTLVRNELAIVGGPVNSTNTKLARGAFAEVRRYLRHILHAVCSWKVLQHRLVVILPVSKIQMDGSTRI